MNDHPPLAKSRMGVAVLSLAGGFVAFYLLAHNLGWAGGPIQCGENGGCGIVQASRWASVGPVPVSGIGLAGYSALFVLSLLGLQTRFAESRPLAVLIFGGALLGFIFTAWLTYLEAVVIRAWCRYCVASAAVMSAVFLLALPEWRRMRGASS